MVVVVWFQGQHDPREGHGGMSSRPTRWSWWYDLKALLDPPDGRGGMSSRPTRPIRGWRRYVCKAYTIHQMVTVVWPQGLHDPPDGRGGISARPTRHLCGLFTNFFSMGIVGCMMPWLIAYEITVNQNHFSPKKLNHFLFFIFFYFLFFPLFFVVNFFFLHFYGSRAAPRIQANKKKNTVATENLIDKTLWN